MVIAVKIKTDVLQVALHQAGRTWPSAMPSAKNNDAPFKGSIENHSSLWPGAISQKLRVLGYHLANKWLRNTARMLATRSRRFGVDEPHNLPVETHMVGHGQGSCRLVEV